MRSLLFVAASILLVLAVGCAPPAEQVEAPAVEEAPVEVAAVDDATLDELVQAWDEAMNSGDSAQIAALYVEGGTMMPPESPAMVGMEAIGGFVDQLHAQGTLTVQDDWVDYHASADTIAAHGTWTLDIAPAEGDAVQDSGRWIAMWAQQADGSWKVLWNIWNSDRLPEGMAAAPGAGAAAADEVPQPATSICPSDAAAVDPTFVSTFVGGDLAGNVATHAEYGVRHPPYMESVAGRPTLTSFIAAYMETFEPRELTVDTLDTYQADDWGASWGTYSFNYTMRDGSGALAGDGKYANVVTRGEDGCWRSDWVLWNSDTPPM